VSCSQLESPPRVGGRVRNYSLSPGDRDLLAHTECQVHLIECPTEIAAFGGLDAEFASRGAQLLGVSIDTEFVHLAWRRDHPDLRELPFPMLADVKRELSTALGILDPVEGVAQRATFVVDPDGIVRFVMVTDLNVGRNTAEVLRVLDALQTDELVPCNWRPGESTPTGV
jgi:lipoyl-dependent peroxiredoxin subunit C